MLQEAKTKLNHLEKIIEESSKNLKKFKQDLKSLKDDTSQKNYEKIADNFCKSMKMGHDALQMVVTFFSEYQFGVDHQKMGEGESLKAALWRLDDPYLEKRASHTWSSIVESKLGKFDTLMSEAFGLNEAKDFSSGVEAAHKKFDQIYKKICKEVDVATEYFDKVNNLDKMLEKNDLDVIFNFHHQFTNTKKFNMYRNAPVRLKDVFETQYIVSAMTGYCCVMNTFKKTEHDAVNKRKWFREQQLNFKFMDNYLKDKLIY